MEVNRISQSPNFKAKMVVCDSRIQKFIKASFLAEAKDTYNTLDKFTRENQDAIVSVNFKLIGEKMYMTAKNGSNNQIETKLVHDTESVKLEDNTVFIDLIKKTMENKTFWMNK